MTKKKVNPSHNNKPKNSLPPIKESNRFAFDNYTVQSIFLVILGLILYANSFDNEYALDDGIVIQKNEYVQRGIKGIPKILSTDAYDSFYRQMNARQELAGGRYRPLSIVTFAIEQSLFGSKEGDKTGNDITYIRHMLNVVFYILSIVVLLYFLRNFIFKDNPLIAFIACLIFLIHPIHTEVVANVKSRDEILSFLFIILTFIAVFRYRESKKTAQLFYGLLFYFLAFLSKEYAITLLILIPISLYVVKGDSLKESLIATIPFFLIAVLYLFIRLRVVGFGNTKEISDVLNAPFKFATKSEKWGTKIEILIRYLKLLIYPDPLSSDYSYKTIRYYNFKDGEVWLSIIIHLSLIAATIVLFFKRNILAFALAIYLLYLALICNLLMDIGATMGERLIYHSSLGFAIIIAVAVNWLLEKIKQKNVRIIIGIVFGCLITTWCAAKVIKRNAQWKNDSVLFIADAETVPNSVLVNGNAGKAYIDSSDIIKPISDEKVKDLMYKAIKHLNRAVATHTKYVNGYLNLGVAYFKLKDYDKAKENWDIAKQLYPNNPFLKNNFEALGAMYYNNAIPLCSKKPLEISDLLKALQLLEKAVEVSPDNPNYWYDLGGVSYMLKDFNKAHDAWAKTLLLDPNHKKAKIGMAALTPMQVK